MLFICFESRTFENLELFYFNHQCHIVPNSEQTAAEARSAPIPPAIQGDAELLDIYRSSLDGVLAPLALRSVEAYRFCVAAFDEMSEADGANAPAWGEWRAWCEDRGVEVLTLYGPPTGPHGEEQTTGSAQ